MHTFYLDPCSWPSEGDTALIAGDEAQHLIHSARLKTGAEVRLVNGLGLAAICEITEIGRNSASLRILETHALGIPESRVTLAVGWGKSARRSFLLEKAAELEAWEIWFWQAKRSPFALPDISGSQRSQAIAGAKQSGNPFVPRIKAVKGGVSELIGLSSDFAHKQVLLESGFEGTRFMSEDLMGLPGDTLCVIGPEGGFDECEVNALLDAGFCDLSMGDSVLRWETASVMALGLHWWVRNRRKAP